MAKAKNYNKTGKGKLYFCRNCENEIPYSRVMFRDSLCLECYKKIIELKKDYKDYRNSPKGRLEIPNRSGSYILLDKNGKAIYEGITDNLKRRILEHHYDKSKCFSYIRIKRKK